METAAEIECFAPSLDAAISQNTKPNKGKRKAKQTNTKKQQKCQTNIPATKIAKKHGKRREDLGLNGRESRRFFNEKEKWLKALMLVGKVDDCTATSGRETGSD